MTVTALIADDEPLARAGIRSMLDGFDWVRCVGEAASGPAALTAINTLKPDLVFLDIQMPGLLGTEVLRRIHHQPYVVFTTAHALHAVAAFELGALDYLLKPFGPVRFAATLERIRTAMGEPAGLPAFDRLTEALARGPMRRLFVRSGASVVPLAVAGVAWFEARGDYVAAHVADTRHLLHLSLTRLADRLEPSRFVRIHRTHIVNLDFVKAFRQDGKGRMTAELLDGTMLPVSRGNAALVRALGR